MIKKQLRKIISLFIEGDIGIRIIFSVGIIVTSFLVGLIIVYIKEIILTIITILFVIYLFKPPKAKKLNFQEQHRQAMHSIPPLIFKVLQENSLLKILGVDTPKTIEDILPLNYIIGKNGFNFFRFQIIKVSSEHSEDKLDRIKQIFQQEINKSLAIGFQNLYLRFNNAPYVWIDELLEEDGYMVFDVALIDNQQIYDYLSSKQRVMKTKKPISQQPKDSDF